MMIPITLIMIIVVVMMLINTMMIICTPLNSEGSGQYQFYDCPEPSDRPNEFNNERDSGRLAFLKKSVAHSVRTRSE